MKLTSLYLVLVLVLAVATQTASGQVAYVDLNAGGDNSGTNWANAYENLTNALAKTGSGTNLWVAEGTYYPGTNRLNTFQMKSGVNLYGGFTNGMSLLGDRDWTAYETVLGGDIGVAGDYTDNSAHILNGADNSTLDGFTISDGYWPLGLITAAAGLIANLLFILALRVSSLSLTVPVLGLVPVFTTLFGAVALNEIPSGQQSVGIALSVLGLLTLYLPAENPNPVTVIKRFATDPGARYMLGVTLLWSATAPLDKASMALSSPETHGLIQVSLISAVLI
ncbi:MAG: EamA family transporter, partial [Lentisphaerae bacterium]|nr:EamA family transporter [Lentisphaerota bacterium]